MPTAQSYIICATPRSGSTLLCDLLDGTGVAGRPASYFREQSLAHYIQRLHIPVPSDVRLPDFGQAYLAAILQAGRGETPIFGLRLMWESLDLLARRLAVFFPEEQGTLALLQRAFGPTQFIHLSRTDKVAQAISRVKALQTGLWHLGADGTDRERTAPTQPAEYDRAAIQAYVDEVTADDQAWSQWFGEQGIAPLRLTYEALSQEPRQAVEAILISLGLDPLAAATVEPRTARLSDPLSADWASRFHAGI